MMERNLRARRLGGLLLLLSTLPLNEWVLGPLFADDGTIDGAKLLAVRAFDLIALAAGLFLLLARRPLGSLYRDGVMVLFHTVLLLVVLNLAAWTTLRDKGSEIFMGGAEMAHVNPDYMRRAYGVDDIEAIKGRITTPGATGHPALSIMMRPIAEGHYHSGPEGTRRSCRGGEPLEAPLNGAVWMFGGSTTYGSGVSDCETVASALNDLDPANTYLNFGVESRVQNSEIEHLLLLLRKGYRPKAVLFLDGLNDIDINALQEPLFSPFEATAVPQQPYYFRIQNDDAIFHANLLANLPLVRALSRAAPPAAIEALPPCGDGADLYRPDGQFHTAPLAHYGRNLSLWMGLRHFTADQLTDTLRESCGGRMVTLYRGNGAFLATLAEAFGFDYRVYFQPLAVLSPENPFIRDPATFRAGAQYALLSHLVERVRGEIAAGALPGFHDLSRVGMECGDCWVDPNHYTPAFNRRLAEAMLAAPRTER